MSRGEKISALVRTLGMLILQGVLFALSVREIKQVRGRISGLLGEELTNKLPTDVLHSLNLLDDKALKALAGMTAEQLTQVAKIVRRITNPADLERLLNRAGILGGAADPNAATRLERALDQLGPGAHSPADIERALDALKELDSKILHGRTAAPVVPGVAPTGEARRIIGAHSPEILGDPVNFNILSQTTNPDGTITAKFTKLVSPGPPPVYSKPKTSTLAPPGWTSGKILAAGDRVAATPAVRGPRIWGTADGATLHIGTVNGVEWAVIKDASGRVTSSFPTGGQPTPF